MKKISYFLVLCLIVVACLPSNANCNCTCKKSSNSSDIIGSEYVAKRCPIGGDDDNTLFTYAARDIQAATGYLNQARAYLASDQPAAEYALNAARELQTANTYLNQAKGYLATDQPAVNEYSLYAARELNGAMTYLSQAGGYIRELTARLSSIRSMTAYQNWANQKLMLFKQELRKIAKPRIRRQYRPS